MIALESPLQKVKHPYTQGQTVRPYIVGYGCDGSTDLNIHYIAQTMVASFGLEYREIYDQAYGKQDGDWISDDLGEAMDEALETVKVKDATVIPPETTVQDVLDDLYQINNRSLVTQIEEVFEERGISLDTQFRGE